MNPSYPLLAAALLAVTSPVQSASVTLTFQEGVNGYAGTLDTMVRSAGASSSYGAETYVSVDGDDGSPGLQPNHGLIRFDNLFGNGAGQIQASDSILSATLKVVVHNPGSGMSVYDMLANWSESSTWNSLGSGVQVNGVEALSPALVTLGADNSSENVPNGVLSLDVTASLQAMQGGASRYGWAMIPFTNGTNGIDFYSSEFATLAQRPLLSVEVMPVPEPETYALMLAGLGLVGALSRRVRR